MRPLISDLDAPYVAQGDASELIRDLPDNSVDAIVTDPPYGLNIGRITGQRWDRDDTIAFSSDFWYSALQVIKPGGLLLAFGASRTWHRLATAIEDAGFDIEDTVLAWCRADKKLVDKDLAREFTRGGEGELAEQFADCHTMFKPAFEPDAPWNAGSLAPRTCASTESGS
jgi:site-specific DNA-methyltransferase (adenine-specific)